jgi:short-subunit dehydrogenase
MSKTILITGAGSGFGKLAAFDLANKDHRVIATTQDWAQVTALKNEAQEIGVNLEIDKLDVTNGRDRENAVNKYDIDILVSNAGVLEAGPIAEQPTAFIRSMFETNFFGALELVQGFVKKFVEKRAGKVVFTSSASGLVTVPYAAAYCASKHALEAVAEGLKTELEPFGIKIATTNPGAFLTGFNERGMDSMSHWYDPNKNFTPPESFASLEELLANQYDPQSMVDVIVDVILSDHPKFRNVHPPEAEEMVKESQKKAWTAKS